MHCLLCVGRRDTLVIEFQQRVHPNYAMWELSPLLSQNYWCLISSSDVGGNVTVPHGDVIGILHEQLGSVKPDGFFVDLDNDFPKALVGM